MCQDRDLMLLNPQNTCLGGSTTRQRNSAVLVPRPAAKRARLSIQAVSSSEGQSGGPLNDLGRSAQKAGSIAWAK